jgi:hypothetical protein
MAASAENGGGGHLAPWRILGWGGAAGLLLIPRLGHWPWTLFDYVFMAMLLAAAGLVLELAAWASRSLAYRVGAGLAAACAFLLVWINGAVGVFGDEGNPANLMFAGVIAVAAVGAALARFRAAGMARAMGAAALAQLLVAVTGPLAGLASPGVEGLREAVLAAGFAVLWLGAAGLFRRAAEAEGGA